MRSVNLFSIVLIAIVAGCASSGGGVAFDQNSGVRIEEFSFDLNDIYEGESVTMALKVQNVGAKTMTGNSRLWIYGPTMGGADKWGATPAIPTGGIELPTTTFTPPDVNRRIPGAVHTEEVILTAPTPLPENMLRTDTFYARVCYPYETESITRLVSSTRNQMRIEALPNTDAITRASAGPIQLRILSGENIIAGRPIGIVFEVSDVGGGISTKPDGCGTSSGPDLDVASINRVYVTVNVDGAAVSGCTDKEVLLSKGKGTIYCTYTPAAGQSTPKMEYAITAKARYNYYITKEASITVNSNTL